MRTGQERRSKPPRAHRSSSHPPAPLSESLLELEEHSFRLPLTLPAERHVKSIIPPPPPPPIFDEPLDRLVEPPRVPRFETPPETDAPTTREDDALLAQERASILRGSSMPRWLALAFVPIGIVAIAACVRAAVIWGRTPAADVNAANVATATPPAPSPVPSPSPSTVIVSAKPVAPAPEPPAPTPKAAPPPEPSVTPAEQTALDRAAAKKETFEAQAALEVGDGVRAARAARRATALDPSDAHGWLLLVAAELDCRNPVAANEALRSCLTLATRGPRGECIGMVTGRAARAKKTMDVKALSSLEPPDIPNAAQPLPSTPAPPAR